MAIEGRFVNPSRMDEEESRIARRPENVDHKAVRFRADRSEHFPKRRRDALLPALAGMEAGENEKFHCSSDSVRVLDRSRTGYVNVSSKIANGPPRGYMYGNVPHFADRTSGELHAPGRADRVPELLFCREPQTLLSVSEFGRRPRQRRRLRRARRGRHVLQTLQY
jgi:hypothetical protein